MKIHIKLAELKKEIGKVKKNATNPHFKNNYADINAILDSVEPLMESKGLLLLQPLKDGMVSTQIYCVETGELVTSELKLPEIQDPQKIGSAITYYRRYTLQSLLGLQAEDDDGQKASYVAPQPAAKPQPKPYVPQTTAPVTTAEPKAQLEPEFKLF
jgi:hypothetical protein